MTRTRKAFTVIICITALAAVIAYYATHDPQQSAAPQCLFHALTGYDCPGCGSQRALHAILHGDIAGAWHFNPFIFIAVPVACLYGVAEIWQHRLPALHRAIYRPAAIAAIAVAIVAWWVLRNL